MVISLRHAALTAVALLAAGQAPAQDWRGFYVGGNLGYGRASGTTKIVGRAAGIELPEGFTDGRNATLKVNHSGACFGGQMGYNWQIDNALFGVEGDITRPDMKAKKNVPIHYLTGAVLTNGVASTCQEVQMLTTVRARVGYIPSPKWLMYVTGGLAIADVDYSSDMDYRAVSGYGFHLPAKYSQLRCGYALGAGSEFALAKNLTARAEYLYYSIPKKSKIGTATPVTLVNDFKYTWKMEAQEVRFGLNFMF